MCDILAPGDNDNDNEGLNCKDSGTEVIERSGGKLNGRSCIICVERRSGH